MGLRSNVIPLEDQLAAIDSLLKAHGPRSRRDKDAAIMVGVLKAVHANLQARLERPRSLPLGELETALRRALAEKGTGRHYHPQDLAAIADTVIRRWPHIREALEWFGEETAG